MSVCVVIVIFAFEGLFGGGEVEVVELACPMVWVVNVFFFGFYGYLNFIFGVCMFLWKGGNYFGIFIC